MREVLAVAACLAGVSSVAGAANTPRVVTVQATDEIYAAGLHQAVGGGTVPRGFVSVPGTAKCFVVQGIAGSMTCSSPEGCITLNKSDPYLNDPDGDHGQVSRSQNDGTSTVSGITAPGDGYLVGLFVAGKTPSGAAPPALDFTTGSGTAFTSLSPMLDQTFYVGDGLVRDDGGHRQRFMIPAGATRLYFGISDACGFEGAPNCYVDNAGTYQLAVVFRQQCSIP